jgi:hypothetical protein
MTLFGFEPEGETEHEANKDDTEYIENRAPHIPLEWQINQMTECNKRPGTDKEYMEVVDKGGQ